MKKILAFLTSLSLSLLSALPMNSFSYDYDYYLTDYIDENNYFIRKEYKNGIFSDANSRFNECDLYTLETIEAYEDLPTLKVEYDYLIVPDRIIGNWFENRKSGDARFKHQYDVKLPLHTGYDIDEFFFELHDSHCYDIYIMWKKVPYISITTDTNTAPLDNNKLEEMFSDAKLKYIGKNKDGNYVHYLSTGEIYTNFNEYECDVNTVLTYEDAQKILELGNEHILSFSYCSSYEMQKVTLPEYPVYSTEYVEKAAAVFETHGFNVTIEDSQKIIPDEPIPALEYFEIISEIQEKEGVMPSMRMYEASMTTVDNSSELINNIEGDINGDGNIGIADIVMLEKYLLGRGTVDSCADINKDGYVDVYDLVLMRKILMDGII